MKSNISIEAELQRILTDYNQETVKAAKKIGREVSEEAVDELKASSPKNRGEYAKGWMYTEEDRGLAGSEFKIHNATHPGLTHLLERGHVVANQAGSTGKRTKPRRHIKKVETKYNQKYYERIVEEVNGIK